MTNKKSTRYREWIFQRTDSLSAPGVCPQRRSNTAENIHKIWRIRNSCGSTGRKRVFPQLFQFSRRLVSDRECLLLCHGELRSYLSMGEIILPDNSIRRIVSKLSNSSFALF